MRFHRLGRPPHPDVLTPAEWQVLELIREGHPNAEIASRLGITVSTTKTHVTRILAKTGAENRQALRDWDGEPSKASRAAIERRRRPPLLGWLGAIAAARTASVTAAVALFVAALLLVYWQFGDALRDDAAAAEPGSFVDMLRFVPDAPNTRSLTVISSIERYRELVDVDTPGTDLTLEDDLAYINSFAPPSADVPVMGMMPDLFFPASSSGRYRNAYEQTRGWIDIGLADTDQMLRATALRGGIFRGRFDLDRTELALAACDECPAHERRVYRGWTYLSWVDETGPDTGAPFSLETLGNLAIRDGYAIHSTSVAGLEAAIDAREGSGSLVDYEPFRHLAETFDALGTTRVLISTDTQDATLWTAESFLRGRDADQYADAFSLDAMTVLRPYTAIATGAGVEEDGRIFDAVALAHASGAVARENADRLRQRFDEWIARGLVAEMSRPNAPFSVEDYTEAAIDVEGRIVTIRLYGGSGRSFSISEVPLFLHEPR